MARNDTGRPPLPKGICGEARAAFKRLRHTLERRGHLTKGDGEILTLYAYLFDRHQRALLKLAEQGEVRIYTRLDSHGQPVSSERPNLWLKIAEASEQKMLICLSQLGLTPRSRKDVKATPPTQDPVDIFELLLEEKSAEDTDKQLTH